jgi:hypothetical protein
MLIAVSALFIRAGGLFFKMSSEVGRLGGWRFLVPQYEEAGQTACLAGFIADWFLWASVFFELTTNL